MPTGIMVGGMSTRVPPSLLRSLLAAAARTYALRLALAVVS
jgi:hypothetical protein